jgi:hypothetical protein
VRRTGPGGEQDRKENTKEGSQEEEEVDADQLLGGGDQQESQRSQKIVSGSVDTEIRKRTLMMTCSGPSKPPSLCMLWAHTWWLSMTVLIVTK